MTTEKAIEILDKLIRGSVATLHSRSGIEALEMAIKAMERRRQIQRVIEILREMSAKYTEMYLETAPDTEDHILDRVKYRTAADIYANAANMAMVPFKGE